MQVLLNAIFVANGTFQSMSQRRKIGHLATSIANATHKACMGYGSCPGELECRCFVLGRGLKTCQEPRSCSGLQRGIHGNGKWGVDPHIQHVPPHAFTVTQSSALERSGMLCAPYLPEFLGTTMDSPPLMLTGNKIVDPRKKKILQTWSLKYPYYSRYTSVLYDEDPSLGFPILAGKDVSMKIVLKARGLLENLIFKSSRNPTKLMRSLVRGKARVLLAGRSGWTKHPELIGKSMTGVGGGAPWFPSTGIDITQDRTTILLEEFFHTIQYMSLSPRDTCAYHRGYQAAFDAGLYTTDHSGPEYEGEPVPTLQADEYFATAFKRWFGLLETDGLKEYKVRSSPRRLLKSKAKTGREELRAQDPKGFCLVAQMFRSDDTFTPDNRVIVNRAMNQADVDNMCAPILAKLVEECPSEDVVWPVESMMRRKDAEKLENQCDITAG